MSGIGGMAVKQLQGWRRLGAIEHVKNNACAFPLTPIGKNPIHQIAHAVGAVGPADQGCPPLFNRCCRCAIAIDRDVHQCSCLHFLSGLLHQFNLA